MKIKELKDIINEIPSRDDDQEVTFDGRHIKDFWWMDCADGYVFGYDKEIEADGFITREEDLMKSKPLEQIERANTCMTGNATARPIKWCIYPKCEECHEYEDEYCTVPMVITKQIYRYFTDEMVRMDKDLSELKKLVYDEILGEPVEENKTLAMYKNITWDEVEQ